MLNLSFITAAPPDARGAAVPPKGGDRPAATGASSDAPFAEVLGALAGIAHTGGAAEGAADGGDVSEEWLQDAVDAAADASSEAALSVAVPTVPVATDDVPNIGPDAGAQVDGEAAENPAGEIGTPAAAISAATPTGDNSGAAVSSLPVAAASGGRLTDGRRHDDPSLPAQREMNHAASHAHAPGAGLPNADASADRAHGAGTDAVAVPTGRSYGIVAGEAGPGESVGHTRGWRRAAQSDNFTQSPTGVTERLDVSQVSVASDRTPAANSGAAAPAVARGITWQAAPAPIDEQATPAPARHVVASALALADAAGAAQAAARASSDAGDGSASFGSAGQSMSRAVAPVAPTGPAFASALVSAQADAVPPDTAMQIVQAIRLQALRDGGEAHIKLDPRQFGDVTIRVRVEQGQVNARVEADAPVVREWLQGNQHVLRQNLAGQQLTLDRLDVQAPPESSDRGRGEDAPADREGREQGRRQPRRQQNPDARFEVLA